MSERPTWTPAQVPNQSGRVAVVTGGGSGLGLAIATALAGQGAHVVIAVRDVGRGDRAVAGITAAVPGASVDVQLLDLASLASVRQAARDLRTRHSGIDLLINNAGVMWTPLIRTEDGFELQMGTNHLGHFALTGLLLPLMLDREDSRVITVSSSSHRGARLDFDDLNAERSYDRRATYARSKLANLLFTYELQRRLDGAGCCHQGAGRASRRGVHWADPQCAAHMRFLNAVLGPVMTHSAERGALSALRAATDPRALGGEYYGPRGLGEMRGAPRRTSSHPGSHDVVAQLRLWEASVELTGVQPPV